LHSPEEKYKERRPARVPFSSSIDALIGLSRSTARVCGRNVPCKIREDLSKVTEGKREKQEERDRVRLTTLQMPITLFLNASTPAGGGSSERSSKHNKER